MAIVTFLSDFGDQDYYVPAVKAKMLCENPQLNIIDISHKITRFDLAHAAFVLRSCFREFPKGTVHLVAIDTTGINVQGYIGVKLEDHFFVAPNNGILSLLSDYQPETLVKFDDSHITNFTFPAKDILAPMVVKIASGSSLQDLGEPLTNYYKIMPRHPRANREQIVGNVLRVDEYGNVMTNIQKEVFDKLNPGKFIIRFGRESVTKLNTGYSQVEGGDCFAFFNSLGLLEIGIHIGRAGDLLGLKYDSLIHIEFETE